MLSRVFLAGTGLAVWLAMSGGALAQESTDDERARLHFNSGRSYFEEGNYEQALEEFNRAYALSNRVVLLVNIANCQERLGMWREAADSVERYVASLPEGHEERPTMQRRIENLRTRAARQEAPPDRTPSDRTPDETPDQTPDTGATTEPAGNTLLVPSLIAFGVGGVGLLTFGILGLMALGEESSIADGCGATRSCTEDEVSGMDGLALGADIGLAIGVAGVATGVILIIAGAPGDAEERPVATLRLSPAPGGLALSGEF